MTQPSVDGLVAELERVVGASHVLTEPSTTESFTVDWTGRFHGHAAAVVRPSDTNEVAAVIRVCAEAEHALVPQGGNTGLVGGGVPLDGEIVLSLRRLDQLDPVDTDAMQVTVGAGVTLAQLQQHAAHAGLAFGVDLAARDSATVGGLVATNAGGVHFLRFGGMRRQLLGVTAVLADGSVVSHIDGLEKDNTGYDLTGLLCGSEGTLGVVTAARVRLVPRFEHTVVALLAFDDVTAAVRAAAQARRTLDCLNAAEILFGDGLDLVCRVHDLAAPFVEPHPVYLLLEAADHTDPTDAFGATVSALPNVNDVAVATDATRRAELWSYRELHTTAINSLGPPHKLDVTLPVARLAEFIPDVRAAIAMVDPAAQSWLFGHVADGNIHVNVTGVEASTNRVDDAVFQLVARYRGSISAEHGIGTVKKPWLHLSRSEAEITAFRRIKTALDPRAILNPNALLPDAELPAEAR
jgi:FAD/FMN-containing dehydrogenase